MSIKPSLVLSPILVLLLAMALVGSTWSASQQQQQQADEKVKVGVYIESLCPDSRRFFLRQLVPTFRSVGAIIEPHIVVFGKARTLGNNKMICQHGSNECEGNRRMACVQTIAKNSSEEVETIGCLFENHKSVDECVKDNIGTFKPAAECRTNCLGVPAKGGDFEKMCTPEKSYKLMLEAEKETGRLQYVPHLTMDGQSSEQIQNDLETDLLATVCKQYKGANPPVACAGKN